jgi:hypothetical protein
MRRLRSLILANLLALALLLGVLLIGWRQAAAFGLGVLVVLDLIVLIRERSGPANDDIDESKSSISQDRSEANMNDPLAEITYEQARNAYEAGVKLHHGGQIYLVQRSMRETEGEPVLWVTDEQTRGDHGLLLYPDGRSEIK